MKKLLFLLFATLAATAYAAGNSCDLHIQVVTPPAELTDGDPAVAKTLATRLVTTLNKAGYSASANYGQFMITGRFDDIYKETVPGPPASTAVHTTLTLMVADILGNKVFASESFDLRGVGNSQQRAYLNALGRINATNQSLESFLASAQSQVINYFDNNYKSFLAKARVAATQHNFDEALYYAGIVPQCSKGYEEAEKMLLKYYQEYIDYEGIRLLNAARHAFAISPNAEGAVEAYALLEQIDPSSAVWSQAMTFAEEVKRQTKKEYDFEVHQKYEDALNIELRKIDAARQIGVAFGQGQAPATTNILWK